MYLTYIVYGIALNLITSIILGIILVLEIDINTYDIEKMKNKYGVKSFLDKISFFVPFYSTYINIFVLIYFFKSNHLKGYNRFEFIVLNSDRYCVIKREKGGKNV